MATLPGSIRDLSDTEKFDLLDALWVDLESHGFTVNPEQAEELDRRAAAYEQAPAATIPWEQVKAGQPRR